MTHQIFNILLSFFVLFLGIRMIYITYKEPSDFYSTNIRGYISGSLFIVMSLISLSGKFSLFGTASELIKRSLKLKDQNDAVVFALWIALVCLILFFTYYRPDKMLAKYKISKDNTVAKAKLLSSYLLFYFGFSIVALYLIVNSIS